MKNKIIICIVMLTSIVITSCISSNIYAVSNDQEILMARPAYDLDDPPNKVQNDNNVKNNIINQGNSFWDKIFGAGQDDKGDSENNTTIGESFVQYLNEPGGLLDMVKTIGNLVVCIMALFLGVKYIWSGIDGKAQIKETLPSFVIGVIMFYGATTIWEFVFSIMSGTFLSGNDYETMQSQIAGTVYSIVNMAAMAGIIFVGLKYMWSSAGEKANIKGRLLPMVIGIILVFSLNNVLKFIMDVTNSALKSSTVIEGNYTVEIANNKFIEKLDY